MIQISLCDDEVQQRSSLRKIIERSLDLRGLSYHLSEFESGEALLAHLSSASPDILFLDIEMGQLNGMETARLLRKQTTKTILIFVTSHPDYVFQGYEVKALNYLLKPCKEAKVIEVLETALAELEVQSAQSYLVAHKGSQKRVALQEICYFWSERRKVHVQTTDQALVFYGKLNDVENELPDYFIRIHNRYLVNLHFVQEVSSDIVYCAGQPLPLSRANKQALQLAFARNLLE